MFGPTHHNFQWFSDSFQTCVTVLVNVEICLMLESFSPNHHFGPNTYAKNLIVFKKDIEY